MDRMTRNAGWMLLGLCLTAGMGGRLRAHEGHQHGAKAKDGAAAESKITVTGEVLDLSCYLGHGAKGQEHKPCAKQCLVQKHVPAGLLTTEGDVYLLVPDHDHEGAFKSLGDLAAEQVRVTGKRILKGGLPAILVEVIEKR